MGEGRSFFKMSIPILVSFPDLELESVIIEANTTTSIKDVIKLSSAIWDMHNDDFDISFNGDNLEKNVLITSLGIQPGDELTASRIVKYAVTLSDLKSNYTNIELIFSRNCNKICYIDSSTMMDGTRLLPDVAWKELIPNTVKQISFLNSSSVTEIGEKFLSDCAVSHVDLTDFVNVDYIDYLFLSGCTSIVSLDLSPLVRLDSVGYSFMCGCTSVTDVNLAPLKNFIEIGFSFMTGCASLTTINLSECVMLECIGTSFLRDCSSLTALDLSPLSNVSVIGHSFLAGCSSLMELDLSPLLNVDRIETYSFLADCPALREDADAFLESISYRRQETIAADRKPIDGSRRSPSSSFASTGSVLQNVVKGK